MSLIHDALRDMEGGSSPVPAGPVQPPPRVSGAGASTRSRSDWVGGVAAFTVVVAAGAAGWMLLGPARTPPQSSMPVPAVPAPPAVQSVAPMPSTPAAEMALAASAPSVPSVLTGPSGTVQASPAVNMPATIGTTTAAPSAAASPAPAVAQEGGGSPTSGAAVVTAERLRGASAPASRAVRKTGPASPAAPAAPEPVEDKPVEQRFAEFMVAMNAQDWSAAQQQLDALRKRLPPQAVGLLRAQAWFDLQRGELDQARQGYQQLLERMPGDEEAAVNLASVLSRQGQGEAARQVLLQAVQIRPDAPRLRDALRRFTPEVRP